MCGHKGVINYTTVKIHFFFRNFYECNQGSTHQSRSVLGADGAWIPECNLKIR